NLFNLDIYIFARKISNFAWSIMKQLPSEFRYHPGNQFVRSADSVGANIAEGYGRFAYKDKIRFHIIARGSLVESIHWTKIMLDQNIIPHETLEQFEILLYQELRMLNNYIKYLQKKLKTTTT
ncbi:four helix bundle protein, partial [Bacteroidota bacterium]